MNAGSIVTVVPFYNRRHTILAALAGVAAQTVPTGRLIVVDDGSTDGGADGVRAWIASAGRQLNCRLVVQSNRGVAAARNRGLALAGDSEFVAFLDSDDVWPRDFLERTGAALAAEPRAVAATCDRRIEFCDGQPSQCRDAARLADEPALWMLQHGADISSATLFRVRAVEGRGGFNPALRTGEDSALFLPLSLDGPWLYAPGEPVTVGRGLAESLGDEPHLSGRFRDNHRIWAGIYEDFFLHGGGHAMLADAACRRLLAEAWYQAGRELLKRDDARQAVRCFGKSISWNPRRTKYCGWMVRAWIGAWRRELRPTRQVPSRTSQDENPIALAR